MTNRALTAILAAASLVVGLLGAPTVARADATYCGTAYVVRGEIEKKYLALGGPGGVLGCPKSDETTTPDGAGRFTTFANGSVYWTAATGAHTVWGEIGRKWGTRGWERGYGYPVSDEYSTAAGLRQDYQRGSIVWRSDVGFRYSYVALGDSYSAGTGAVDDGTACHRSGNAYGPLLARDAGARVYSFAHPACSGARTNDVIDSQLAAVRLDTDVVTLTIGGNDANFANVLSACANPFHGSCNPELDQATTFIRSELPARLDRTLTAIHAKAPNATVIIGGYPLLFSDPLRGGLVDVGDIDASEARRGNEIGNLLDDTIRAAAGRSPRTVFVDPRAAFTGHAVDADANWLNPVGSYVLDFEANGIFHPNRAGQNDGYRASFAPAFTAALS